MQRLRFRAMGCQMLAVLDTGSAQAADCLAEVPAWFADWEQRLSRFQPDSELSQLNRCTGRPMRVSLVLWEVLQAAVQAARQSDGLVVPTLLNALEAIGYDRSFETLEQADLPPQAAVTPPGGDWGAIKLLDARTRSVYLPSGLRLDLGGISKGWAADRAARQLGAHAPALVDAGGDIAVSGPQADGQPWPIGVTDPAQPDSHLALLLVREGGVATSGRDYRRWQRDGVWQHHILDPRTGRPAETDVLAATVVAPTVCQAEAAVKAALILGSQQGLAWLEARPALAGLLVLENGRVVYSHRIKEYLWS